MAHAKSNWGARAGTLRYRQEVVAFDSDAGEITTVKLVEDGVSEYVAEDLVRPRKTEGKQEQAEDAILEALGSGSRASTDVQDEVRKKVGCSRATFVRAANQLRDDGLLTSTGNTSNAVWSAPIGSLGRLVSGLVSSLSQK